MEQTLVILKPDTLQRRLAGRIIQRLEEKGLTLVGLRLLQVPKEKAERLYAIHRNKPFYISLVSFLTSGPVVVLVVEAPRVIEIVRKLIGKTFGYEAEPGTIRGDFGVSRSYNLIHASDSPASAAYEIPIFFTPEDLVSYQRLDHPILYHPEDLL